MWTPNVLQIKYITELHVTSNIQMAAATLPLSPLSTCNYSTRFQGVSNKVFLGREGTVTVPTPLTFLVGRVRHNVVKSLDSNSKP